MKNGEVVAYTSKALATIEIEAERTAPFLSAGNRSPEELLQHTKRGLLGEAMFNYLSGDLTWWVQHRKQVRGKTDDGGQDAPDGTNVKTVLPWQRRAYVNFADTRASRFVVVCLDEKAMTVQVLGQFKHADVHDFPDGGRGIFLEELKELT